MSTATEPVGGISETEFRYLSGSFAISYQPNKGSGTMADDTGEYGEATTIADNAFTYDQHEFAGWNTAPDGGGTSYAAGDPYSFVGNITLYAQWAAITYKITVEYQDLAGADLAAADSFGAPFGSSFTAVDPGFAGYALANWKLDGIPQGNTTPAVASVSGNATITLVYKAQQAPPGPVPDPGNYQFVKKPNVKNVSPGETVVYTFSGFANGWGFELEHYSIMDKPDKGIDFKGARLPAFTNGSKVAYDVVIYTSSGSEVVLYSHVPADSPFAFDAPPLRTGEYITGVALDFGTVPSGFAAGNTLEMTFRVWDNPPSKTLYNTGILSYKVGDEYKEFVTGAKEAVITLGGSFGPQTGDDPKPIVSAACILVASGVGALVLSRKRKGIKKA